ncbi:hypothetical protein [uncultured Robinsoniella sp.]|uniref:hypothetical protein n=1 Tax=uncultured Robinsoniella sp. TaxID=904190 RepID=UPI00374F75A7
MMIRKNLKKVIVSVMTITFMLVASNSLTGCALNKSSPESKQTDITKTSITEEISSKKETIESTQNSESQNHVETQESQTDTDNVLKESTEVKSKVQLYDINYFDESILGFDENNIKNGQYIAEDYYELVITNVTDTKFDFTIFKVNASTGAGEEAFPTNTATFTGDGTTAAFSGNENSLSFSFPDDRSSFPVVTSIKVSGFSPIEGITFTNNGIPGYEFS